MNNNFIQIKIDEAKKIHNNKYDYSKVTFNKTTDKVIIICPIHGEFNQSIHKHTQGDGCKECGKVISGLKRKLTTATKFINESNLKHLNIYDYSKVNYESATTNVIIICKIHGEFNITPNKHLSGIGCKICSKENQIKKLIYPYDKWLEEVKLKHNNIYNYSKVDWKGTDKNVIIICKIHGEFSIRALDHREKGCFSCFNDNKKIEHNKLLTENFIKKHKEKHGDNIYNYNITFINNDNKVNIICNIHGPYSSNSINLAGCKKCSSNTVHNNLIQNNSKNNFKIKANIVHNNKYDYSKVNYINAKTKIEIICNIHGSFFMTPNNHLNKKGCKKCGIISAANKKRYTKEEIINKLYTIFGNEKYNYNKLNFNYIDDNVIITCLKHGDIKINLQSHLNGSECSQCRGIRNFNTNSFIEYCKKIHNNLYEYDKTIYTNIDNKVIIKCKTHGYFDQSAYSHAEGLGCKLCSKFKGYSNAQIEWLNYMAVKDNTFIQHIKNSLHEYKIGDTNLKADGYSKELNTIYEFHGSFFHGSPNIYNKDKINPVSKKTYGELYIKTIERENLIKSKGYKLKVIWEEDWIKFKKTIVKIQKLWKERKLYRKKI